MALKEPNVKSVTEMSEVEQRITSVVLIGFTVVVALLCIFLLGSTLTQTRLSSQSIDGVPLTIRKIDVVGRTWADFNLRLQQYARQLDKSETEKVVLLPVSAAADGKLKLVNDEMEGLLSGFNHTLQQLEPELAGVINGMGYPDQVGRIAGAKNQLVSRHPQLSDTISTIEKKYGNYRDARNQQFEAAARLNAAEQQIKLLAENQTKVTARLNAIFDRIREKMDPADRARVENAFYETNVTSYVADEGSFWQFIPRWFYTLLTMQPDMLTLFLVLAMGVLGSALQITHAFFIRGEAYTVGRYFQRLSVGALTALVIFIVAKAGIPIIAEPSRLTGEASVNPYFVSFLAIISGLLSENAITYVQTQGTRLFGQAAGIDRWARPSVMTDFTTQQLSIDALAQHLGDEPAVVETKLNGKQKLDAREQEVVALYMRGEPRDLFTDIAPA